MELRVRINSWVLCFGKLLLIQKEIYSFLYLAAKTIEINNYKVMHTVAIFLTGFNSCFFHIVKKQVYIVSYVKLTANG